MDLPLPDFKSLHDQQIYYLYGFAGLLLLLLLAVFRAIAGPSKQTGAARKVRGTSNVLFIGPMASGKTSLFGRLVYRSPPPTHTSLTSNSAILPGKNIQLIDLPGHPRLRSHLLAQYLPSADGVVFFIDPTTNATAQGIQTTAEHLHVLLSMLNILESKGAKQIPPVLLLLTKSDTWTAAQKQRAQDRVKTMLERELEKRRRSSSAGATSSARLESIDELPSGSSASPFRVFSWLWRPYLSSTNTQAAAGGLTLPEDEQEILQTDVLDFGGPISWDEDKLGCKISWATSTSKGQTAASADKEKTDEKVSSDLGVEGFWNWLDEEVL